MSKSNSPNRNWIIVYINPKVKRKLKGNPKAFKFRYEKNSYKSTINYIKKEGFKINAVYLESISRQTGQVVLNRRLYDF